MTTTEMPLGSRAARRQIVPGIDSKCLKCDLKIGFVARKRAYYVICNVYVDGKWSHIEYFHDDCYENEYGEAQTTTALPWRR